jgi:endonuclease/exonuclease/phosphatase family metal-dependent hydrolase
VILARGDVEVTAARSGHYVTRLPVSIGGIPLDAPRGWTMADVEHRGESFRFVNTHLESAFGPIQEAQGRELVALLGTATDPVILVGDLNSPADKSPGDAGFTSTYRDVLAAGFSDPWRALGPQKRGFTCCQTEDLRNVRSMLTERIDFVLLRGGMRASAISLVGEKPHDRTRSGLWPSDHAGVVAKVRLAKHGDVD